jgi:hypothetical protein
MEMAVLGVAWLAVSSVSVTCGRFFRRAAIAYPVAAVASFALLSLVITVVVSVPALSVILKSPDLPFVPGQD